MKKNLIPFVLSTLAAVTVLASCNGGNGSGLKKLYVSTYNNADPNMSNLWKPGYDANAENSDSNHTGMMLQTMTTRVFKTSRLL